MNNPFREHRAGYVIGWFFSIVGLLALSYDYYTVVTHELYHKNLLFAGVFLFVCGATFLVFPGSKHRIMDYPGEQVRIKLLWEWADTSSRIAWVVAIVSSFIAVFTLESTTEQWAPLLLP